MPRGREKGFCSQAGKVMAWCQYLDGGNRFTLCRNHGYCRRIYVACRFGSGGISGGSGIDRSERVPAFCAARFARTYSHRPMTEFPRLNRIDLKLEKSNHLIKIICTPKSLSRFWGACLSFYLLRIEKNKSSLQGDFLSERQSIRKTIETTADQKACRSDCRSKNSTSIVSRKDPTGSRR